MGGGLKRDRYWADPEKTGYCTLKQDMYAETILQYILLHRVEMLRTDLQF